MAVEGLVAIDPFTCPPQVLDAMVLRLEQVREAKADAELRRRLEAS